MKKDTSICIVVSAVSLVVAAVFHRYFPGFGAAFKPLLWPLIILPFAVRFRYAVLTGAVVPFLSCVINGMPTAVIALKLSLLTVCLMSAVAAVRAFMGFYGVLSDRILVGFPTVHRA